MSDDEYGEDIYDHEVANDVETIRMLGTEREENERFQTYTELKQYPPGYKRHNTQQAYVEVIEQPPVSLKTGFQTVASSGRILFAANGPDIHSFDILFKSHLSTWKWPKEKNFPEIPVPLKTVYNPNLPGWALQQDEIDARREKAMEEREKAIAKAKAKAEKEGKTEKEGPAPKRRRLNKKDKVAEPDAIEEADANNESNGNSTNADVARDANGANADVAKAANGANADVAKDASSEGDVDKLDPFPARAVNPEVWHSAIVGPEESKSEPLPENGEGLDIDSIKYKKSSVRPPDVKPEGWVANQKANWRRPEFRPERRLEWKHQPSTATSDIPMVQCLCVTADGKHVVAATGSDKTIWVFEHDGNGQLTLLSQRYVFCFSPPYQII